MRDFFTRAIRFSKRADAELALRHEKGVWLTGNLFLREGARFFHASYLFFGTCGCGAGVPNCKGCLAYGKSFFLREGAPRAPAHACYDKAELRTEKDLQARTLATTKPNSERKKTCKRARLLRGSRTQKGKRLASAHACCDKAELRTENHWASASADTYPISGTAFLRRSPSILRVVSNI